MSSSHDLRAAYLGSQIADTRTLLAAPPASILISLGCTFSRIEAWIGLPCWLRIFSPHNDAALLLETCALLVYSLLLLGIACVRGLWRWQKGRRMWHWRPEPGFLHRMWTVAVMVGVWRLFVSRRDLSRAYHEPRC